MTRLELGWARCIVDTLFPGCADEELEGVLAQTVGAAPLSSAVALRVAVVAATVAPVVVLRRPALLGQLTEHERLRVLDALGGSSVYFARGSFNLLKAVAARACASAARRGAR